MTGDRVNIHDYSKMPLIKSGTDYRFGGANVGDLLGFAPYEGGYCFLSVMSTPAMMRKEGTNEYDNRKTLLETFCNIIEQEFLGLSGLEDQQLETTTISNNILEWAVPTKNSKSVTATIEMTYTEKSGTPLTKFLEMYTNFIYDPYSQAKTYGQRLRTDPSYVNNAANIVQTASLNKEVFNLLYVITDATGVLVEKAYILYNAIPINVSHSTLFNMNKFEVETKAITINWVCMPLDGRYANKVGQMYVRNLMKILGKYYVQTYDFNYNYMDKDGNKKAASDWK